MRTTRRTRHRGEEGVREETRAPGANVRRATPASPRHDARPRASRVHANVASVDAAAVIESARRGPSRRRCRPRRRRAPDALARAVRRSRSASAGCGRGLHATTRARIDRGGDRGAGAGRSSTRSRKPHHPSSRGLLARSDTHGATCAIRYVAIHILSIGFVQGACWTNLQCEHGQHHDATRCDRSRVRPRPWRGEREAARARRAFCQARIVVAQALARFQARPPLPPRVASTVGQWVPRLRPASADARRARGGRLRCARARRTAFAAAPPPAYSAWTRISPNSLPRRVRRAAARRGPPRLAPASRPAPAPRQRLTPPPPSDPFPVQSSSPSRKTKAAGTTSNAWITSTTAATTSVSSPGRDLRAV